MAMKSVSVRPAFAEAPGSSRLKLVSSSLAGAGSARAAWPFMASLRARARAGGARPSRRGRATSSDGDDAQQVHDRGVVPAVSGVEVGAEQQRAGR